MNELLYYVFRFLIWNRTMWFIGTKNDLESTITTNSTTTTTTTTTSTTTTTTTTTTAPPTTTASGNLDTCHMI